MTDPTPKEAPSSEGAPKEGSTSEGAGAKGSTPNGTGPRVSLMPWNNTGNTAAGGVLVVAAIIALPLIIGLIYMVVQEDPEETNTPPATEQAP